MRVADNYPHKTPTSETLVALIDHHALALALLQDLDGNLIAITSIHIEKIGERMRVCQVLLTEETYLIHPVSRGPSFPLSPHHRPLQITGHNLISSDLADKWKRTLK